MAIQLTAGHISLIGREAEHGYPDEVCGFLYGRDGGDTREIQRVVPVVNEQHFNRARRFLITPDQFRHAESRAHEFGLDLLGFYHSHPDHPAIPSEFDREHALPFYSYVIISVRSGRSAELRSWLLLEDRSGYAEETIRELTTTTI
ncbi:M67 family metallopeptidase [candidate division KSB1 bacterium]|nr:M67 family metallopeptidase [candidate division KSB1 bacterium]